MIQTYLEIRVSGRSNLRPFYFALVLPGFTTKVVSEVGLFLSGSCVSSIAGKIIIFSKELVLDRLQTF